MKVFAVGDIHGCFAEMLEAVKFIEENKSYGDRVIFLGDYCDRGPDSKGVIEFLKNSPYECLQGNHDEMLYMTVLKNNATFSRIWSLNGGRETIKSYKPEITNHTNTFKSYNEYGNLVEHAEWLKTLPLYLEDEHRIYVHAGLFPNDYPLDARKSEELLWIRHEFLQYPFSILDKVVVFGHTPMIEPRIEDWKVGLDTGCVFGHSLSVGVFEDDKLLNVHQIKSTHGTPMHNDL